MRRRSASRAAFVSVASIAASVLVGGAAIAQPPAGSSPGGASGAASGAAAGQVSSGAPAGPAGPGAAAGAAPIDETRSARMRDYHASLEQRRLGSQEPLRLDVVKTRVALAEEEVRTGRVDEAVARLVDLVEHPRFSAFAEDEAGRAAVFLLGDALATAGAYAPARAYLQRVLATPGAWDRGGTYARRAVRRLVEIAIESDRLAEGVGDVKTAPASAPEETRGEIRYLEGRAREAAGDPDGAIAAYAQVPTSSRFWAQATYLEGLLHVEHGRYKQGEDLFCKIADPKRTKATAPVFADERFFAVRDLARLALGRVAHEQFRFDDSRYYYYLVPRDSDRLAEALYEAATSRYEKKDYEGARELLDQLKALGIHHRYEDEVWILDAYLDLAQCKFPESDKKLITFIARYQPVRDAARRIASDERGMQQLLAAARAGSDAGGSESAATVSPEAMRTIAALVRIDPQYAKVVRRRAILEHEAAGLRLALGQLGDMQKSLAASGEVRAAVDERDAHDASIDVRDALEGVKRQIDDLSTSGAPAAQIDALRAEYKALDERAAPAAGAAMTPVITGSSAAGKDVGDLLRADAADATSYAAAIERSRQKLAASEASLAKEALRRVDLRLSRLLRRARLGRIESVLGRKRALEVEIEALNNGILPPGALDSLEAARYLKDNEEYWPFEGDDWPDEYVGGETLK